MEKWRNMAEGKGGRLILTVAGVYIVMRFLLPLVYPLVFATLIVIFLHPWLKRLERRTHIGVAILTSGFLFFIGTAIILAVWLLIAWVSRHVSDWLAGLELFEKDFEVFVTDCCEFLEGHTGFRADALETLILERVNIFINNFQINVMPNLMRRGMDWFRSVISLVAGIMVTFIGAVLLAKDYEHITGRLRDLKGYGMVVRIVSSIGHLAGTYLRAQAVIMTGISVLSVAGLFATGIDHFFALGLLAGLLDALPFIGTGVVLMPLAFFLLVQGNYVQAGACVLLYTVCALFREVLEPKLIGGSTGFYPAAILAAVYVGIRLYGLGGVILGPLTLLLIREIMKNLEEMQISP